MSKCWMILDISKHTWANFVSSMPYYSPPTSCSCYYVYAFLLVSWWHFFRASLLLSYLKILKGQRFMLSRQRIIFVFGPTFTTSSLLTQLQYRKKVHIFKERKQPREKNPHIFWHVLCSSVMLLTTPPRPS